MCAYCLAESNYGHDGIEAWCLNREIAAQNVNGSDVLSWSLPLLTVGWGILLKGISVVLFLLLLCCLYSLEPRETIIRMPYHLGATSSRDLFRGDKTIR